MQVAETSTPSFTVNDFSSISGVASILELDITKKEVCRSTGMVRVPLVMSGDKEKHFLSFEVGEGTDLPFGISEPFGSIGAGPVRTKGQTKRQQSPCVWSMQMEIQPAFSTFLTDLQTEITALVWEAKDTLKFSGATLEYLVENRYDLVRPGSDAFTEREPQARVKVPLGGRNGIKVYTSGGNLIKKDPCEVLVKGTFIIPTCSLRGVWSMNGKWGIIMHVTEATLNPIKGERLLEKEPSLRKRTTGDILAEEAANRGPTLNREDSRV